MSTHPEPQMERLADQALRLLHVRRMQTGGTAAATQRKLEALFRDNPGLDDIRTHHSKEL